MLPAPLWLALVRAMLVVDDGTRITQLSLHGESKEEAASPQKKEANPASLRSAAPSKGRGSRGHSLLPMEGGAPKGRRLDGESGIPDTKPSPRGEGGERSEPDRGTSGMKDKWGNASQVEDKREHPIHRWRGPPSPMGKAAIRGYRFSRIVRANTGYMWKNNIDGQSLPRVGKVASGASRIGF